MGIKEIRDKQIKDLYEKDRIYFRNHESEYKDCEKVWEIPLTSSCTTFTDKDHVGKIKMFEIVKKDENEDTRKLEYFQFSNYNELGDFVGDNIHNCDSHNTNAKMTKPAQPSRFKFKPYDK